MSIKLEIKELAKIKDSEIELKPFTIFFGESNTNKSYTLIASYFWYKLVNGEDKELLEEIIENLKVEIKELSFEEFKTEISNKKFAKFDSNIVKRIKEEKEIIFKIKIECLQLKQSIKQAFEHGTKEFFYKLLNNIPAINVNIWFETCKENVKYLNILFTFPNDLHYFNAFFLCKDELKIIPINLAEFITYLSEERKNKSKVSIIFAKSFKKFLIITLPKILSGFSNKQTKLYFFPPSRSSIIDLQNSILLMSANDIPYPGLVKEFLKTYLPDIMTIFSSVNNYTEDKILAKLIKEIYQGSIEFNIQTRETTYQQENLKIPILATASSIKELTPLYFALKHNPINEKIFFIEEPEAHLHPELQVKVAYLLSYIVNKGGKVNITTHSDYLVNALGTLVKLWYLKDLDYKKAKEIMKKYNIKEEYLINPENLGVYYFEKQKDNSIKIKEIKPDKYGIYPKSFEKVMERDLNISEEIELALLELKRKR